MTKNKKSAAARKKSASRKQPTKPVPARPAKQSPIVPVTLSFIDRLRVWARTPLAGRLFAVTAVVVLFLTTLFWTVLSARLHESNADQLIDAYLFESANTFQNAAFPGTHTFLIKWPLFALMHLYGNTLDVFTLATVLMVLTTIGTLVYVLYRIEKRPMVFGLYCLALSSVLLLIPAQPYAGALLPVNQAMTTTRNLEYVVYLLAVYFGLRSTRLRSRTFAAAAMLLALVVASDKLFAVLAIGGGLIALVWYAAVVRQRLNAARALRWLAAGLASIVGSTLLLLLINLSDLTNIVNEQTASPFPLIHSFTQLAVGLIYGFGALLTNFGANPVHGVLIVQDIPAALGRSLLEPSIAAYVVNLGILALGLYGAGRLVLSRSSDIWTRLSVVILGSLLTAGAVFVLTDHYYPVDARYLTIGLFAIFIAAASYFRNRPLRTFHALAMTVAIVAVLPVSMVTAWQEYRDSEVALSPRNYMTQRVSEELDRHGIKQLIGDYWDVTPVTAKSDKPLTIRPVDNCLVPRPVLNSAAWFKQPAGTPAAYLAVKDPSPDDVRSGAGTLYGGCSLAKVVASYGVPSERVAIQDGQATAGNPDTPDVLLLLYGGGIKTEQPAVAEQAEDQSAVALARTSKAFVPFTEKDVCSRGTTLQVVAHQDDDLLFMNPDLSRDIRDGRCIRTVYMTAGDAGENVSYWGGREQGAKAAYAQMYGVPDKWQDEQQLLAGRKVTVAYLQDVPAVSLVFMRLPDGNLRGQGFAGHGHDSIRNLLTVSRLNIRTVDATESYSKQDLVDVLKEIMVKDIPDHIRTHGSDDIGDGDHADHQDVGILTGLARATYLEPHTISQYLGYPTKDMPVNLSDEDITAKQLAFIAYAKHDGAVCQTAFECQTTYTYGGYLTRMYGPVE